MGKSKLPLTRSEVKERHNFKRRKKEIEDQLDREEVRSPRRREHDEEQGKSIDPEQ